MRGRWGRSARLGTGVVGWWRAGPWLGRYRAPPSLSLSSSFSLSVLRCLSAGAGAPAGTEARRGCECWGANRPCRRRLLRGAGPPLRPPAGHRAYVSTGPARPPPGRCTLSGLCSLRAGAGDAREPGRCLPLDAS